MKNGKTYSARSQRSLLRQSELQAQLREAEGWVQRHQGKIAQDEASKTRICRALSKPVAHSVGLAASLRATNDALTDHRDQLAYSENECTRLRAELESLNLGPAESKARAKQQALLVSLVAERLEKDRQADKALSDFRRVLQERAELSRKMAECSSAIEFTHGDDGLDTERFDRLLASLPDGLVASSEQWGARLFGERPADVHTYLVQDDVLILPETLLHHGIYHHGDKIELREAEARELLRDDRRAPTPDAPWMLAAPSIITLEAYAEAEAKAEADGRGFSGEDILAHRRIARLNQLRQGYAAHYAR